MSHSCLRLKGLVLASSFFFSAAPAAGWFDEVDRYVASLNSPAVKDRLGLKEARRPERVANRLEVTFEGHPSPQQRSLILRQIGREFLRVLFRWQFIPMATIVERNGSGRIVGSIVLKISGGPPPSPETLAERRSSC